MSRTASLLYDPNPAPPDLECGIFKRVQVFSQAHDTHLVAWELNPGASFPCEPNFFVDFGRPGTNEWEPLSNVPIVNACIAMDVQQRHWDHLADFYYRVRMVVPCLTDPDTGTCVVHLSQPQQANGIWSKQDWLLAREIARKEYLLQRKRTNQTAVGYIFKRRRFGQRCHKCLEYDTTEQQSTDCAECLGTGFLGGYFPGVDMTFTLDAPWTRGFTRNAQVGMSNNILRSGRAVAYPYLDSGDVFHRLDTAERFAVGKIQQVAEVGGIPVVVLAELRLVPVTDLIYRIPLSGGVVSSEAPCEEGCIPSNSSDSSPSPVVPAPCDYRVGLEAEEDW